MNPAPRFTAWRVPTWCMLFAYALLFTWFATTLQLTWDQLSPVQDAYQLDGHTQRFVVTHQDTPEPRLTLRHVHEGIRLIGTGLRGLQLTELNLRIERDCELEQPHRHSAELAEDDLVVALAAKAARRDTIISVSLGRRGPLAAGTVYGHVADEFPAEDWREFRSKVDFGQPTEEHSAVPRFSSLLLEVKPASTFDLVIREVRLLAVPRNAAARDR